MRKTNYTFELDQAKKLVPVMGNTTVTVETDGEVDVINCRATVRRGPRKVVITSTQYGELSRSPMGLNRTVKITLPTEQCTIMEVKRQVDILFDKYLIELL